MILVSSITSTRLIWVEDDLSRMTTGSVSHIDEAKNDLPKEFHRLGRLGVTLEASLDGVLMVGSISES